MFHHFKFTERTFTAYPSIWPLYVQNVELSAISFPFDRGVNDAIFVICHEILHSFFYEFVESRYLSKIKELDPSVLWDISEIFNVLVQERKDFLSITGIHPEPYPQHKQLYHKVKTRLEKEDNSSIEVILDILFSIAKNSGL